MDYFAIWIWLVGPVGIFVVYMPDLLERMGFKPDRGKLAVVLILLNVVSVIIVFFTLKP